MAVISRAPTPQTKRCKRLAEGEGGFIAGALPLSQRVGAGKERALDAAQAQSVPRLSNMAELLPLLLLQGKC